MSPAAKAKSETARLLYLGAGHLCLALGVLGIVLPVVPAAVILVAAAACYAKGSQKFYDWLLANKWLGPPIKDWQRYKSLTLKSKVVGIVSLLGGMGLSIVFVVKPLWLRIVLGVFALGATVFILLIKTRGKGGK